MAIDYGHGVIGNIVLYSGLTWFLGVVMMIVLALAGHFIFGVLIIVMLSFIVWAIGEALAANKEDEKEGST